MRVHHPAGKGKPFQARIPECYSRAGRFWDVDDERFIKEIMNYRGDLLRGYKEPIIRCPVVELLDDTYISHVSPRL
jgi:hypothetical protein